MRSLSLGKSDRFHSQRKFDKVFRLLTKNEEELLKNLNDQEKELFDKVKACYDEIMAKDTCYLTDRETKIRNEITEEKNKAYIEGPGHMPLDQIEANMKLQQTICMGAPFYVRQVLCSEKHE